MRKKAISKIFFLNVEFEMVAEILQHQSIANYQANKPGMIWEIHFLIKYLGSHHPKRQYLVDSKLYTVKSRK